MPEVLLKWDTQIVTSIFKAIQNEVIAQGYMPDISGYGDTLLEAERYANDVETIVSNLGFNIEVYNQSSQRRKGKKNSCRIVIYQSRTYEGEIGAPNHAIISNDKTLGGKFKSGFMPLLASNIVVAIHLISSNSDQFSVLNSILGNVIGQRQYMFVFDTPNNIFFTDQKFLAYQSSFNDASEPKQGVIDQIYFYTIPDVYISGMTNITEITPISTINLKTPDDTDKLIVN